MNDTGFVTVGADDPSVVTHNSSLTGSAPVDSGGPKSAEPVADEVTAELDVVTYEACDRALTGHAAWPEPMRVAPASPKRRSGRSEVTTFELRISARRG